MTSLREARAILDWHLGRARWIYVHIPKNAGVSLRKTPELAGRMLATYGHFLGSPDYVRTVRRVMAEAGEHHGITHARWRDLNPRVVARLPAVAVLRNPWARVVSRWRFAQLAASQGKAETGYAAMSLEAFLEERHIYGGRPYYWHRAIRGWYPQRDYVCDEAGQIRCDLLRFEALDEEAQRYFRLRAPPPRRNSSRGSRPWQDEYDARTIQTVADWYAADIDLFGFDFDTAALRNTLYSD